MKAFSFLRLCALSALLLVSTLGMAQQVVYTEAPVVATSGYWSLVTDAQTPDHTLVRFYNARHELLYEEELKGVYLDPNKPLAARRRVARRLGTALQQVQRMHGSALVSPQLLALNRQPK